jgi:uncharacterized protein YjiS (DUF1127 family)
MLTSFTTTPFLGDPTQPDLPARPVGRVRFSGRQPLRRMRLWRLVEAWRRHRTRQLLAGFDGHMLKDIGVTFAEAEHEVNKPFWVR